MKRTKPATIASLGILSFMFVGVFVAAQVPAPPRQTQTPGTPAPQNAGDPNFRLAVDVQLVNLNGTVLDERGNPIEGLKAEDFKVIEGGQEQKISFFAHDREVPISLGILFDRSGSMRAKLQQALQTVRAVTLALSPTDEMFLVSFANDVEVTQGFTSNTQDIQRSLRGIQSGGDTAVYDAIQVGLNEMKSAKNPRKILLLVSDGYDSRSKLNLDGVEELLKRSQTAVYAIGIDDDDSDPLILRQDRYHLYHYMLGRVTGISGGRAFRMFTGRSYALESLAQLILGEMHEQYTIGYYPATPQDGTWRDVEVKVNRPNAEVHFKNGYFSSPSASR